MSNKKFGSSMSGKGYYIALILCAVAIGISGYLYYSNTGSQDDPNVGLAVTDPVGDDDLQVVATQPNDTGNKESDSTKPSLQVTPKPMQTVSPVEGEVIAVYAMDSLGYNATTRDWRTHNGIDIAAEAGTKVCAAAAGTVYTVYEDDTMGTTVVIRHEDGYITKYASLDKEVAVQPGETVGAGQPIGMVGNTALLESAIGDHLHFSVTCNDKAVDPAKFLGKE